MALTDVGGDERRGRCGSWSERAAGGPSKHLMNVRFLWFFGLACLSGYSQGIDVKRSPTYQRLKSELNATPAIDTHDHPMPFDTLTGRVQTEEGFGMTLYSLWKASYYTWFNPLTPWPASGRFDDWWPRAKNDFMDARATSFYRYQLPAFEDLYQVDFDVLEDAQARDLNRQIFENYQDSRWFHDVITNRANIELMLIDPYWARFSFTNAYPFGVLVLNVTTLIGGTQPLEFPPNEPCPNLPPPRDFASIPSTIISRSSIAS
jgi:hypothetical protein